MDRSTWPAKDTICIYSRNYRQVTEGKLYDTSLAFVDHSSYLYCKMWRNPILPHKYFTLFRLLVRGKYAPSILVYGYVQLGNKAYAAFIRVTALQTSGCVPIVFFDESSQLSNISSTLCRQTKMTFFPKF